MFATYLSITIMIIAGFAVAAIFLALSAWFGAKRTTPEKQTTYESGVEPVGTARKRFNVRFYMVAVSFIIFDITDTGNDNIYMLKLSWDNQLKWWYQNGTMDYMGRTQGFQSSGQFNGYRVMMTQTMPAIWVKDPTKVLKIVMRNPITGGSF